MPKRKREGLDLLLLLDGAKSVKKVLRSSNAKQVDKGSSNAKDKDGGTMMMASPPSEEPQNVAAFNFVDDDGVQLNLYSKGNDCTVNGKNTGHRDEEMAKIEAPVLQQQSGESPDHYREINSLLRMLHFDRLERLRNQEQQFNNST